VKTSRQAIYSLILANLIPLAGVLFFDWDLFTILVLYWLENGVIGCYTLFKILMARQPNEGSTRSLLAQKGGMVPFFIVHYGLFWLVHGVLVTLLFAPDGMMSWHGIIKGEVDVSRTMVVALISLFASHGLSFWRNFIGREEYLGISPVVQMMQPYGRVVVLHIAVLVGGFFVTLLGTPLVALICLILFKTVLDLWTHTKAHRHLQPSRKRPPGR